jgi:hypothetical protein
VGRIGARALGGLCGVSAALVSVAALLVVGPAAAQGTNPVLGALVKTVLSGSVAFDGHAALNLPADGALYVYESTGELGRGGARAYVAASEKGHGAARAQVRIVGEGGRPVLYALVGALAGQLPSGKTWVRVTVADVRMLVASAISSAGGLPSGLPTSLPSGLNPTTLLQGLGRVIGTPTQVGPTDIAGHPTMRYHVTIRLEPIVAALGLPAGAGSGAAGLGHLSLDAWVDQQDGYLRQLHIGYRAAGPTPPWFSLTYVLHDFGSPVHVTAPPASATVPLSEVAALLGA